MLMVFKRKIKSKNKEYWILVHSIRKGEKIIQKTRYIGKVLPPKIRLERLKKEFLKELNVGKSRFFSENDIKKIEAKKNDYKKEFKGLSLTERKNRLEEFIVRFTYDSSKLSGADITLRQTSLILREGIMPEGFKNIKTARELENHEKGIIAITKYKGVLNLAFIKKIHKILFSGIDETIAGKLRNELKRDVKIAGTTYFPPKWNQLKKELINFFAWYKTENRKLHPLELSALIHLKIISIQPFIDGNSRLSRLLMNWILWKKDYPLIDIPIEDIENYYNALDKYQIEKKENPFVNYIKERYFKE
jgi:Fic family protein